MRHLLAGGAEVKHLFHPCADLARIVFRRQVLLARRASDSGIISAAF